MKFITSFFFVLSAALIAQAAPAPAPPTAVEVNGQNAEGNAVLGRDLNTVAQKRSVNTEDLLFETWGEGITPRSENKEDLLFETWTEPGPDDFATRSESAEDLLFEAWGEEITPRSENKEDLLFQTWGEEIQP